MLTSQFPLDDDSKNADLDSYRHFDGCSPDKPKHSKHFRLNKQYKDLLFAVSEKDRHDYH